MFAWGFWKVLDIFVRVGTLLYVCLSMSVYCSVCLCVCVVHVVLCLCVCLSVRPGTSPGGADQAWYVHGLHWFTVYSQAA